MSRLPLAGCTFGWLHRASLADALRSLAGHGIGSVELTTAPPHLFTRHFGRYERHELARLLRGLGLRVVSLAQAGFTGPTVYELADGEDPVPRLPADLAALGSAGWSASPWAE